MVSDLKLALLQVGIRGTPKREQREKKCQAALHLAIRYDGDRQENCEPRIIAEAPEEIEGFFQRRTA